VAAAEQDVEAVQGSATDVVGHENTRQLVSLAGQISPMQITAKDVDCIDPSMVAEASGLTDPNIPHQAANELGLLDVALAQIHAPEVTGKEAAAQLDTTQIEST